MAIDLITQHIRMKLQQPDLRRVYHNLEVIPSTFQARPLVHPSWFLALILDKILALEGSAFVCSCCLSQGRCYGKKGKKRPLVSVLCLHACRSHTPSAAGARDAYAGARSRDGLC